MVNSGRELFSAFSALNNSDTQRKSVKPSNNKEPMHTFLIFFQGSAGGLVQMLPILLIIGVFYFLLIRPQQKRQRQLQETIATLKIGDRVVTTGGIIGVITTVRDTSFLIRSADKSILEIARSAIAGIDEESQKAI
jgi:preprotein translocase subunit YajC